MGLFALLFLDILSSSSCSMMEQLRNQGKLHLLHGKYDEAADCYAAVLQSLEGTGGDEVGDIMRRCGLTLAECEIKLGNLFDAVARCSEVIDDTPLHTNNGPNTRHILAKAFYRRGVAFFRLNMPEFSFLDMRKAAEYSTNDTKVARYINSLGKTVSMTNISHVEDQLQDTIEEALSHFPRRVFSKSELVEMIGGHVGRKSKRKSVVTDLWQQDSNSIHSKESIDFEQVVQSTGGSDLFGLANLGDLGGLGGLLSNVFEPGNMQNYLEIFSAVQKFFSQVKTFIKYLRKNQEIALWVISALWIIRIICS